MRKCLILYRGPLQRSRLTLIISGYGKVYDEVHFIWLVPHPKYLQGKIAAKFFDEFKLNSFGQIDGRASKIFSARRFIASQLRVENFEKICLVGTTSLFFIKRGISLSIDLFVNGIPEERLFHGKELSNSIQVFCIWKLVSFYRADRVFAVSDYMAKHLEKRIRANAFYSIPSGIYHQANRDVMKKGERMTYSGSGAPWQWLSRLSQLWQEIHKLDPGIEFLVVSRDIRTKILSQGINHGSIKFVQANNGEEVYNCLQEGNLGFLIRENHIVNQVSFPIKFGEYLAAGLQVIVSDFEWECADFVRSKGGGLLILNEDFITEAKKIINFHHALGLKNKSEAVFLSKELSRENSLKKLIHILDEDK